jgi:hypothetical protein
MVPISPKNPVCKEICDVLGLKHVTRLEMTMELGKIVAVNVTYFPELDGVMQFPAILKKYKLVPLKDEG